VRSWLPITLGTSTFCGPRLSSRSDVRGVIAVVDFQVEAEAGGLAARLGDGHILEDWDADLRAMDGEVHGEDGGDERDDDKTEQEQDALEEVLNGPELDLHGRGSPSP
jgi:hypothetical protein